VFRSSLALSLVRWTWGHAGDAGKVSSKAGMGKIMSNRSTSSITVGRRPCPRSGTPQVWEKCSGATLAAHVIT
jgi:hypothetical protein